MEMQGFDKVRDIVTRAETILDVGARDGQHTLFCSRTNPHSNIYSFEPEGRFFSLLEKNVREAGAKNVTILQNAVGNRKRVVQVGPEDDTEDADMVTIDSINLVGCDYIRLGSAGAPPRAVLLGGASTISRLRPAILFETGSFGVAAMLKEHGYTFSEVGGNTLATSLQAAP